MAFQPGLEIELGNGALACGKAVALSVFRDLEYGFGECLRIGMDFLLPTPFGWNADACVMSY